MRGKENQTYDLEIIAGHCCINPERLNEVYEMSEIQVSDGAGGMHRALSAVRFVGLKSRTEYNETGEGMGIDFEVIEQAIISGTHEETPPSVLLAEQFVRETKTGIAAEIMLPGVQLPQYEGRIPKGMFMPWNPSTNQLGWNVREMSAIAARNSWPVGLKNGKWLDKTLNEVNESGSQIVTSMEKTWLGLATYAKASGNNINFIHRGVDTPDKGDFRNAPVHEVVKRLAKKVPTAGRYFDPSHTLGEKKRCEIVETTIEAMKMKTDNDYLYTGILIEAGTSVTDTKQHVTVDELGVMLREIAKFRKLRGPFIESE